MTIKKVTENELPTLIAVARETFIAAFAQQNNPDDFAAYIESAFTFAVFKKELDTEGSVFYLVYNDHELIGYFKLNHGKIPHDAISLDDSVVGKFISRVNDNLAATKVADYVKMTELERIYLTENTHGKGFAALMINEIVQLSKAENSTFIWLGVWENNLKAIKFYQKSGFSKFGEHLFIIGDDAQTDWLMFKNV
jgi:diamine N-acetyltransferase